jgi:endonuclease/exonuclease/phosphatase family metal-dependent hydrolase
VAELVVATMNLKCRAAHYDHRVRLLTDALAGLGADIVALQEDCVPPDGKSQAEELAEALTQRLGKEHHVARGSTHEAMWHGILFDEGVSVVSAHPIVKSKVCALPSHSFHRRAVLVDVDVRGVPLRFCSTHLDFGEENDPVRAAALKVIYDEMKDAPYGIVAGDMNATPETRAILAIRDCLVDLWTRARPTDPGYTFPANDPDRRIDYLLSTRALADGVQDAWLVAENDGEVWLSDHLGLAARIRV